jgi:hypothetical protein
LVSLLGRPSADSPAVTPELDAVVARALAKSPDDRFATAAELAMAARSAVMAGPARATAPGPRPAPTLLDLDPGDRDAGPVRQAGQFRRWGTLVRSALPAWVSSLAVASVSNRTVW